MKKLLAAFAAAGGLLLAESEYEKKHFTIKNYHVVTDQLDEAWNGYRIAFLSDLHGNCFGRQNEKMKAALEELDPDLILIGGDMMVVKPWKKGSFQELEPFLKWIGKRYPVYYANGNHEKRMEVNPQEYPNWYESFQKMLKAAQIIYIPEGVKEIRRNNSEKSLFLHSMDLSEEMYKKGKRRVLQRESLIESAGNTAAEGFHLLLAHSPIYLPEYAEWGADLVLSGHFHGGTIRIPKLGGVMSPQFQFFSRYNNDYVYQNGVPMIISAGLGTHSVNIRLNNPPQIVVLDMENRVFSLQD